MREWEKPELSLLNLSETRTDGCTCGQVMVLGNDNWHYCHWKNEAHANNCPSWKHEKHYQSDSCPDNSVHWNGSHDSKCCCGQHIVRGSAI